MFRTLRRPRVAVPAIVAAAAVAAGTALAVGGDIVGPKGDGTAITPIGWRVTPAGRVQLVDRQVYAHPAFAAGLKPDGETLVGSNDGQSDPSPMVVDAGAS